MLMKHIRKTIYDKIVVCSQVGETHSLPERHPWTFLAIDGIDGEVL